VLALLTTAAAVVLRCTWGTPVYGLTERVVLGLGMGWISALAGSALYQGRQRVHADLCGAAADRRRAG
jgi:hypothetical protein